MRITRDKARHLVQALEDAREDYQGREGNTSTLWERQRKGILDRLKDLPRLVEKAAARILVKRPSNPPTSSSPVRRLCCS